MFNNLIMKVNEFKSNRRRQSD